MKKLFSLLCCCLMMGSLATPALAVDNYHFANSDDEEYYRAGISNITYDGQIPGYIQNIYDFTPQTVYDSSYGATIIAPELGTGYGLGSEKPRNAPGQRDAAPNYGATASGISGALTITGAPTSDPSTSPVFYPDTPSFTSSTSPMYALTSIEDVRNKDGSIGTLKISKINLTVTAYDGDTYEAMKRGVGHIASTSCWSGNIGLVGHNRGANDNFGRLKELKIGDTITYSTKLGTRTYEVTFVGKIANNDWSYLQYTTDNRLTLLTCVADQPEYRLAVQAVEKNR